MTVKMHRLLVVSRRHLRLAMERVADALVLAENNSPQEARLRSIVTMLDAEFRQIGKELQGED